MRKRYGAARKDGSLLAGATLYCDTAAMNILHPPATSRTLYKASGWAVAALVLAGLASPAHAAVNASQTLILQTGGVERVRITSAGISASAFIGNGSQLTNLPPATVAIGTVADITTRTPDGFWQTDTATIAEGWPADAGWYHLLSATHNNMTNYFSMQFAGDFYNSNNIFYRTTNNVGTAGWNRLWHTGNDGAGSGLDADTVDGLQASNFTRVNAADIDQWQSFRVINNAKATAADGMFIGYSNANSGRTRVYSAGSNSGHYYSDASGNILRSDGATYWHSANDGTGSGLDADTVDGVQLANLVRNNANSGMVPGTSIRFGHANQTNIDDGTIGAGIHASGLNIVGTQTVGGEGRTIRMWGNTAIVGSIVADGTIKAATPVATNDVATKAYVDTAIAAASGGRPKYMGATSTSYNGTLGGTTPAGIQRGHAKCDAQYPGSRMMLSEDIAKTDFTTPVAVTGWVHCTSFMGDSNYQNCDGFYGVSLKNNGNCHTGSPGRDWNFSDAGDVNGMTFSSTHIADEARCSTSLPIHCVKD